MIPGLIDKQDNFELIRDQIAAILVTESTSQQALATAGGKDPALWKLRVFRERSNPWEQWRDGPADTAPIVNVWYDNSGYDLAASDLIARQKTTAIFNIDCYGLGQSADDGAGGHVPGDRDAAFTVHRALRLARNILMAAEYTYLGLRGLVWRRWPQSITIFQPPSGENTAQQIVGARIAFEVQFDEFSPQFEPETLEYVSIDVLQAEDGELLAEADYDYPLT